MNRKGNFTPLVGFLALILVVSASFYAIHQNDFQKNQLVLREASQLKRTMTEIKFALDRSVAKSYAEPISDVFFVQGDACATATQDECINWVNYLPGGFHDSIYSEINETLSDINVSTGLDCHFTLTPGSISEATLIELSVACKNVLVKADQNDFTFNASNTFEVRKTISQAYRRECVEWEQDTCMAYQRKCTITVFDDPVGPNNMAIDYVAEPKCQE